MISCSPELAIELLSALLLLIYVVRTPRTGFIFVAVLSICAAYFKSYGFVSPWDMVPGETIVGRRLMHAAVFHRISPHGIKLVQMPVPAHSPAQLLVRVNAAALRPSELQGKAPLPLPWIRHLWPSGLGSDLAGQVVSVGKSEECAFANVGDFVFGSAPGSLAEFAVVSCNACAIRPRRLSHVQAARVPSLFLPLVAALDFAHKRVDKKKQVHEIQPFMKLFGETYGSAGSALAQSFFKSQTTALSSNMSDHKVLLVAGADVRSQCMFGVVKAMGAEVVVTGNKTILKNFRGAKAVVDYTDMGAISQLEKSQVEFDLILDAVTRTNHSGNSADSDNPPNFRFLLSPSGFVLTLNSSASPFWFEMLKPIGRAIKFLHGVELDDDYHSLLRRPPGEALKRVVQWFEQGALPAVSTDSTVALTTSVALWQTFDRIKSEPNYNPIFTLPMGSSAM